MAKTKTRKVKKNKASKKEQESLKASKRSLIATIFLCLSIAFFWALIDQSSNPNLWTKIVTNIKELLIGNAIWCLPFIFLYYSVVYFIQKIELRPKRDLIYSLIILFSVSACDSIVVSQTPNVIGKFIGKFCTDCFPATMSVAVLCIITIIFSLLLLRISPQKIVSSLISSTIADIKQWNEYRKLKKQQQPNIVHKSASKEPSKKEIEEEPFIQTEQPKIIDSRKNKENDKFVKEEIKKVDKEIKNQNIVTQQPITESVADNEQQNNNLTQVEQKQQEDEPQKTIDTSTFKYELPPVSLLREGALNTQINQDELQERAENLRQTLKVFKIDAIVKDIIPGPVITRYDIVLAPGVKLQSVMNIMDDISLAMKTAAIRIEPIPEKSAIGIEIPNPKPSLVSLRDILDTKEFHESKSLLSLAVGTRTDGSGYISNLAKMPHLLIAGSTGSGKSVGVHNIILSILYKARPDEVKFLLVDPKRVEMTNYKDLPHLYNPCCIAEDADIITKPNEAAAALKKLVEIMEKRYDKYANNIVRNIEDYNKKMEETGGQKDYYIVVIVDELADLMMVASKEIEGPIQRLAQMARAVGIHLILATQRPSVNVITGTIKANFPARMSFQTTSAVDSKVILDEIGAESLIGKGDMLFLPPSEPRPVRLQGAFVSSKEIGEIVKFIAEQNFPKIYEPPEKEISQGAAATQADKNEKDLIPALRLIMERREVSQDLLKANFGGSAKATNLLSLLRMRNFIYKPEGKNRWKINFDLIQEYLDHNC